MAKAGSPSLKEVPKSLLKVEAFWVVQEKFHGVMPPPRPPSLKPATDAMTSGANPALY